MNLRGNNDKFRDVLDGFPFLVDRMSELCFFVNDIVDDMDLNSYYNHLKRTVPIYLHKNPAKPSLADGYYTYALKPSNNYKEYGSAYSYVSIRYDKDIFGSDFGKFDRNNAFIVNQVLEM